MASGGEASGPKRRGGGVGSGFEIGPMGWVTDLELEDGWWADRGAPPAWVSCVRIKSTAHGIASHASRGRHLPHWAGSALLRAFHCPQPPDAPTELSGCSPTHPGAKKWHRAPAMVAHACDKLHPMDACAGPHGCRILLATLTDPALKWMRGCTCLAACRDSSSGEPRQSPTLSDTLVFARHKRWLQFVCVCVARVDWWWLEARGRGGRRRFVSPLRAAFVVGFFLSPRARRRCAKRLRETRTGGRYAHAMKGEREERMGGRKEEGGRERRHGVSCSSSAAVLPPLLALVGVCAEKVPPGWLAEQTRFELVAAPPQLRTPSGIAPTTHEGGGRRGRTRGRREERHTLE